MKHLLRFFALLMWLLPLSASAYDFTVNGIYYNVFSEADKTCEVTYKNSDYKSYQGDVVVPSTVTNGSTTYTVIKIGNSAFLDCDLLNSVALPNTLTAIGVNSFAESAKLTAIDIPSGVTSIGAGAFSDTPITTITLPAGVTEIADYTFKDCGRLTSINLENITSIGKEAFSYATSLTSIVFPVTLTTIGSKAFYNSGVTEVTNYAAVPQTIDAETFVVYPNGGNITVHVPSNVATSYSAADGWKTLTIDGSLPPVNTDYTLTNGGTTITINPGASIDDVKTALGDKCSDITELYITGNYPNKASIDALKTNYFPNLEKVHLTLETTATKIFTSAYYDCTLLSSIIIPDNITEIEGYCFYGCSNLTKAEFKSIESLCNMSFVDSFSNPLNFANHLYINGTEITDVVIPSSITSIKQYTFSGCSSLTSIDIPSSVTSIGKYSFKNCSGLTSISIPSSVASIDQNAFSGCSGLTSIDIPSSVTSIGSSAFYGCSSLESITLPFVGESATAASSNTLFGYIFGSTSYTGSYSVSQRNKSSWTSTYYLPSSLKEVTIIGGPLLYGAFYGCDKLNIHVVNDVTAIEDYALYNCKGLTELHIASSVTSIGYGAFYGCTGLTELTIPSGVTSIGSYAFYGCENLTSINIPDLVTSIGPSTFYGCSNLTSIDIPNLVTSIGNEAFYDCTNLTSITMGSSVNSIGNSVFSGCSSLKELTIPASVTSIGSKGINTDSETLRAITMLPATPPTLGSSDGVHTFPVIYVPAASYDAYTAAPNWSAHQGQMVPMGTKTDWVVTTTADANMSSLHANIGEQNLENVMSLKIIGTINSYDLMIMRNKMTRLKYLDLEEATIVECDYEYYSGFKSKNNILTRYALNPSLLSVKLPKSLTAIEDYALSEINKVVEIEIPAKVKTLGNYVMQNNTGVKSLTIADGSELQSVGNYAFYGCTYLEGELSIPATAVGEFAFAKCQRLTKILVPNAQTIEKNTFSECRAMQETDISSATVIKDKAFEYCTSLKELHIPSLTTSLGNDVFNASKIGKLYIDDSSNSISLGYTSYEVSYNNKVTNYPASLFLSSIDYLYIGRKLYDNNRRYFIYGSQTTDGPMINGAAFVEFGNNLDAVPNKCFYQSTTINKVKLASSVKVIGTSAFEVSASGKTSNLESINLENVETISAKSFYKNSKLANVDVDNLKTLGESAFYGCNALKSCVLPRNSVIAEIPQYAFSGCSSLEKMQLPVSVKKIGNYAFQNCTNMTEMKIPSGITSIGNNAFTGCTKLDNVYTYTIEPQPIDQNTFAAVTYTDALLHVPAVSYYNYYYDTQWSQFLHLTNFDEPYDYVYLQNDFTLRTETAGIISGKPETEIESTGGLIVTGNVEQPLGDVHIKFDVTTNQGASIIAQNNLTADNLYIDVNVKKDFWHFFCFPFDVDLTKIKKDGSYIFRRYDSSMRAANGTGGWRDVEGTTLAAGKGYIFRTNTAGTLSIPVAAPDLSGAEKTTVLVKYGDESTPDENKNWNFVGNTYLSYYDTNSMTYDAPIVVWDGTTYVAYRPGDDDYTLTPFQAFFVQSPNNVADVTFDPDGRMTRIQMETGNATAAKSRARKAARLSKDRQLIDLSISDGENTDKCRVVFNDNQSLNYEMECDAAKFLSSEKVPQIYTIDDNGTQYAINERPMLGGMVYIGFVAPHDGEYTFAASRMDMPVYVVDNLTGKTINLAEGYTFTAEEGTDNTRFAITTKPGSDVDAIETVNADMLNNTNAVIYDLTGKRVEKAHHGVYIVDGVKVFVK